MNLVAGLAVFAALFWLTARRGATDPVCGLQVDRKQAVSKEFGGETIYFCSTHCLHAFEVSPGRHTHGGLAGEATHNGHEHHGPNLPATATCRRNS